MHDKKASRDQTLPVDLEKMALTISVSIFMGILAFFIVLVSYSSDSKEKLDAMKSSISSAFGFVTTGQASQVSDEEGSEQIGQIEEDTAAGLRSVLPDLGVQSRRIPGGQIMTVAIRREDMEDRWPALRTRIGDLIVNRAAGKRVEIQLLGLDGPKSAETLGALATELQDEGLEADTITIGYEKRGRSEIEMRFILRNNL